MVAKYKLGDEVFFATTITGSEPVTCPDCKDTKVWKVTTPAGDEWEHICLRCGATGALALRAAQLSIHHLTIGQIRTKLTAEKEQIEYMCRETGIGGGQVYREDQLFITRAEAEQVGAHLVAKANEELAKQPHNKRDRELSVYRLKDAKLKEAEDKAYEATRRAEQLLQRICELDEFPVWRPSVFDEEDESVIDGDTASITLTKEQVRGVKRAILWLCNKEDIQALLDYEAEETA